jgi:hypothetical protein
MNALDAEPMMSLDKFVEQTGLSAVTVWRYRKKGMLTTVNICGRHYILRAEIARFNERAAAGNLPSRPSTQEEVYSLHSGQAHNQSDLASGRYKAAKML